MASQRVVTIKDRRSQKAPPVYFTSEMIPDSGDAVQFHQFRVDSWREYERLPIPDTSMDTWRRTDIRNLVIDQFHFPAKESMLVKTAPPAKYTAPVTGKEDGRLITFLPGCSPSMKASSVVGQEVVFTDLQSATRDHPKLLDDIVKKITFPSEDKFGSLAAALGTNGALIHIPKGVHLKLPLRTLLWVEGSGSLHLTNIFVHVEQGGELAFIHESASPDDSLDECLNAGLMYLVVGPEAKVALIELQNLGKNVWNFWRTHAQVAKDGQLDWFYGATGSKLSKVFSSVDLVDEGAAGRISGCYFTDKNQHMDMDTQQNHMAPHTTSDLYYKGALEENSRTVWQGLIKVYPEAQHTDGYQNNRNLILNDNARADSIPGLEILADDVRCSHGATVGTLDPEVEYYMACRGIPAIEARRLMAEGFFEPILDQLPFDSLRSRLRNTIQKKIKL